MEKSRIWISSPHMGGSERKYVDQVFDSNWIAPIGPMVDRFEQSIAEYVGVNSCAALSSGTAAIHLALRTLGIGEGHEVIVQSFTFCGSINPVLYEKATPILVDSEPDTWNMSPELLEETIRDRINKTGKKPKAIIPVHLYGMPAKIDAIASICAQYEIPMIEDAAEALGSTYDGKRLGSFGDFGIFSFNGNKIITTSGGGALISNNSNWIEKARFLSTQARDQAIHYQHSELGYNYRLSNVLAGIGVGQLEVLESHIAKRRSNFQFYKELFEASPFVVHEEMDGRSFSNHWLTTIIIPEELKEINKELLVQILNEENIESRPLWKPMHLQPLYKEAQMYGGEISEELFRTGLCLPSGSNLTELEKERIAHSIRKFLSYVQ